ncbi:MAG: hypothetical protein K6F94_07985 [Bacteroidaceae bacterium]|nr:hypothetical protein [Bacteroidaceae bacterium]
MKKYLLLSVVLAFSALGISNAETLEWKYDSSSDSYYVTGVVYCDNPADESYEQMGIYVPGAYMNATSNGDGTYSCSVNISGQKNGFTATSAPIVIPVNTAGYKAMSPPTGYTSKAKSYTDRGFIYLFAGCRGKESAAPSAVTDLKSAIMYFRFLSAKGLVPGDSGRIFSFGHSGGGAQSAILGACGNSSLYDIYLSALGAKTDFRDDICGSMCWCPITNLDLGSEGYEWNMGLTRSDLSDTDKSISKALAAAFATYINALGLKHPSTGESLTLNSTADGYYQSGPYYEYVMEVINDAITRYNKYNNANVQTYGTSDASALYSFASAYKNATKGLGAFDNYSKSRTSAGNMLFDPDGEWAHFDKYLAEIVATYAPSYKSDFDADLAKTDKYGNDVDTRVAMYTPMYYLLDNSKYYAGGGRGSSDVAPHWRIRTGIKQGDTSLCTEINLALALRAYGIEDVDFETIWGEGHTQAEDSGDATENFIEWVERCCEQESDGVSTLTGQVSELDRCYDLSGRSVTNPRS